MQRRSAAMHRRRGSDIDAGVALLSGCPGAAEEVALPLRHQAGQCEGSRSPAGAFAVRAAAHCPPLERSGAKAGCEAGVRHAGADGAPGNVSASCKAPVCTAHVWRGGQSHRFSARQAKSKREARAAERHARRRPNGWHDLAIHADSRAVSARRAFASDVAGV